MTGSTFEFSGTDFYILNCATKWNQDPPFKVISNFMITSIIICAKGLDGLNIPYDVSLQGPALIYTVSPYPHLWKWVLPGLKTAVAVVQITEFVRSHFLKCLKMSY